MSLPVKNAFQFRDISQFRKLTAPINSLYRNIATIEQGSYWRTALVEELPSNRRYRLKTVALSTGPEANQRLQATKQEIDQMAKLDHPNISRLKACLQDDLFLYFLSEAGEVSLQSHLFSVMSLSEINAAHIMQQIFGLLVHCHLQGIMLRALSLSSVYLTAKAGFEVRLVDLGMACPVGSERKRGELLFESMAPETLGADYGPKCDIWSCGFLLFYLISGDSPYLQHRSTSLEERIRSGKITYSSRRWSGRSTELTAFLSRLLALQPDSRPSAFECLADPWLLHFASSPAPPSDLTPVMSPLRRFKPGQEWKKALIAFILTKVMSEELIQSRAKLFRSLDLNGDGYVSVEELAAGLAFILPAEQAVIESKQILASVDANRNGLIDFTEFLMASFEEQTVLSGENMHQVFQYLDRDNDGYVTVEDLQTQFEARDRQEWTKLLLRIGKKPGDRINEAEFRGLLNKRDL
jgi:calcium-dependent protein kinase